MTQSELGALDYVITGWFDDDHRGGGGDDKATARLIERVRLGLPVQA